MEIPILLVLAVGLSMDAFAVSVTNGMCYRIPLLKNALYSGLAFGILQGLMPLLGYYAGQSFLHMIERYDHWIALVLLCYIGIKMIAEAVKESKDSAKAFIEKEFSFKVLGIQAVATSIDALAVGISLGVMKAGLFLSVGIIAATTFIICFAGVIIGKKSGRFLREKAEVLGGVILILIGLNIFLSHIIGY